MNPMAVQLARLSFPIGIGSQGPLIEAGYDGGVLRLVIPVAEKAKPRKIEVQTSGSDRTAIEA